MEYTNLISASVGGAKFAVKGQYDPEEIDHFIEELSKANPANDDLSISFSKTGIGFHIGKNVSWFKVAGYCLTGCGCVGLTWWGGKYLYKVGLKKLDSPKETSITPAPTPIAQTGKEIVEKYKANHTNYDDDQVCGQLIYSQDIATVYASPGVGKTVFCIQMAMEIAEGKPTILFPIDKGVNKKQTVYYYDGEMDEADYFKIMGNKNLGAIPNLTFIRNFFFKNEDAWLSDLNQRLEICPDKKITIFLDNITCVCSTVAGDKIRELLLEKLKSMQQEYQKLGKELTFILIAHTNKQQDLAGSANISNFGTTVIGLSKFDDAHIQLNINKNRKYGDHSGKSYLLRKETSEDGWKHFVYEGDVEPAAKAENPVSSNPTLSKKEKDKATRKEKYEEVSLLVGTKSWNEIQIQTGVSKQCYNNYKKEFGGEPQNQ